MNSRASVAPWRLSLWATLLLALLVVLGATLPGCSGCKKEDPIAKKKREAEERKREEERKRKQKAEEPKPNFEMAIQVLPNYEIVEPDPDKEQEKEEDEDADPAARQSAFTYVKPGHWGQAIHKMKANNFDFPGRLRTSPIDARRLPLEVERTNYRLVSFRKAVLPKGQAKQIDTLFFLPRRERNVQGAYNLNSELLSDRGGGTQHAGFRLVTSLDEYQYFILVLASNNSSYVYMNNLKSVVVTDDQISDFGGLRYYRVILPKIDRSVPLPSNLQTWTTIAYLVWDDIDPGLLTPEQRTSTIDWLHWGGQIIVSGPNSLDKLRGSFLAPYLPAQAGAVRKLAQADVDEMSRHWSLPSKKKGENREIQILPDRPMVGVELKKHEEAQFVPHTGELVAERRIGGGRIVVTAFPLTDLRIRYWKNFDGFFNSVLLRRPGREFDQSNDLATLEMKWAGGTLSPFIRDPRLSTTLRIFTRDIGYLTGQDMPTAATAPPPKETEEPAYNQFGPAFPQPQRPAAQYTSLEHPDIDDWHFTGYQAQPSSGVGGWNDFSGAADAARDSLDESAKIEIPKAGFVLQVLAVYLIVLVPLNWLVFWLLGRVEWSWAAAPVIAIVGAVCVIRLAQLNIGFVRSRTEIAVLEVQRDYSRAHLTRYTTLYTSLSTPYQVSFDDPSAVSLPFVVDEKFVRKPNEWPQVAEFHRDKGTLLSGIQVNSNSTEKVHSEQMLDLKGPISLVQDAAGGSRLKNSSALTLRDVGIIGRLEGTPFPRFKVAYVAEMRPQTMVSLSFAEYTPPEEEEAKRNWPAYRTPWVRQWDQSPVMSSKPAVGEEDKGTVRLHRLVDLTVKRLRLNPGEVRLVAWSNDELPGMQVWPRPAQTTMQTLVLAHLDRGRLPVPERDANVSDDFKVPDPLDESEPVPGDGTTIDATQTSIQSKVQSPKSKVDS
ncbi:MAG TPA: hypothetical protein VMP01_13040 [Pirellulaceae bacterium]|nr:hypothetical protein [Pirellulaceae bacterium]